MSGFKNPARTAFAAQIHGVFKVAQVIVRREGGQFELRHVDDESASADSLREVDLAALRKLADFTSDGAFRPLKSAPTLQRGWRVTAADAEALGEALDVLYPGAVADWHASSSGTPPVTHFREYASRQSGMYRVTHMLEDAAVVQVVLGCCDARSCLKRRLWTVGRLGADQTTGKSLIPCLEPCAVLMESARVKFRKENEAKA